jgi:hypothetical protein
MGIRAGWKKGKKYQLFVFFILLCIYPHISSFSPHFTITVRKKAETLYSQNPDITPLLVH